MPRQSTILSLRKFVAEVLHDFNNGKNSAENYLYMSRLWKLHIGESIEEIQKDTTYNPTHMHEIRGRVLMDTEILDLINVADTDILLYEVRALGSDT